jgi:hypothetical protein
MFIDLCIPSLTEFQKPSDKIEEYVKDAKGEQEIDLFRIYCFSKIEAVAKARENDTNPLAYVKEINAIISQAQDDALSYEGGSKLLYAHKTPVYEPITRHDMHGCGCMMFVLIGSQITSVALQVVTKYIKDNPETISSAGKLGLVSAACILGVAASLGFIASLNGITYIQDRIAKGPQDFMEVMQQQAKMLWDERQEELSEKRAVAA